MKKLFLILFLVFINYNLYAGTGAHALERAANAFNTAIQTLTKVNIRTESDASGIRLSGTNMISAQ